MRITVTILTLTLLAACNKDITGDTDDTDTSTDDTEDTEDTAETGDTGEELELEIVGTYIDDWGSQHVITNTTWSIDIATMFHISQFDNDADSLVANNDSNNAFFPDLWSRYDWYDDGLGSLWYCTSAYDAADEAVALAAPAGDITDPANGGCGGFPWSNLTP